MPKTAREAIAELLQQHGKLSNKQLSTLSRRKLSVIREVAASMVVRQEAHVAALQPHQRQGRPEKIYSLGPAKRLAVEEPHAPGAQTEQPATPTGPVGMVARALASRTPLEVAWGNLRGI